MKPDSSIRYETRRRKQLLDELVARARTRLPDWRPDGGHVDLAKALFEIAARLGSEVAQRLDRIPEKNRRGLMHWLGIRGDAGRAARAPVVFTMTPGADPIDAPARIQLQAAEVDPPVNFETGAPLRILPARLKSLLATRQATDSFVSAPGPILAVNADGTQPTRWTVRTVTQSDDGADGIAQVSPMLGLSAGTVLRDEKGTHYEVVAVAPDTVTLRPAPPLNDDVAMTIADRFAPFDAQSGLIERQRHALYIGDEALLDVATAATIEISGSGVATGLANATWEYWGKGKGDEVVKWRAIDNPTTSDDKLNLKKGAGSLEVLELEGHQKRWLRARPTSALLASAVPLRLQDIRLGVQLPNGKDDSGMGHNGTGAKGIDAEGIANTTPLVMSGPFYPFGREPRQFDSFYLGCAEAFSKPGAKVRLTLDIGDQIATALIPVEAEDKDHVLLFAIGNDGGLKRFHLSPSDPSPVPLSTRFPTPNGQLVRLDAKSRPTAIRMGDKVHVACATRNESNSVQVWIFTQSGSSPQEDGAWRLSATLDQDQDQDQDQGDRVFYTDPIIVADKEGEDKEVLRLYGLSNDTLMTWIDTKYKDKDKDKVEVEVKKEDKDPKEYIPRDGKNPNLKRLIAIQRIDGGTYHLAAIDLSWENFWLINTDGASSDIPSPTYPINIESDAIAWESNETHHVSIVCFAGKKFPEYIAAVRINSDPILLKIALSPGKVSIGPVLEAPPNDTIYFAAGNSLYSWRPFSPPPNGSGSISENSPTGRQLIAGPTVAAGRLIAPLGDAQTAASPAESVDNLIDLEASPFVILSGNEGLKEDRLILVSKEEVVQKRLVSFSWNGEAGHSKSKGVIAESVNLDAVVTLLIRDDSEKDGWGISFESGNWILTTAECVDRNSYVTSGGDNPVVWRVDDRNKSQEENIFQYRLKKLAGDGQEGPYGEVFVASKGDDWIHKTFFIPFARLPKNWNPKEVSLKFLNGSGSLSDLNWIKQGSIDKEEAVVVETNGGDSVTGIYAYRPLAWTSTESSPPRALELSWEYWNGKSWWQIGEVEGNARNFVSGEEVILPVPPDLQPTDVLGRRNHWIRARVVGGDCGEAKTTVETVINPQDPKTNTVTQTQTIHRDPTTISAPYINSLTIGYTMTKGIAPQVVLTEDNGGWLDQSGAARTPNAQVSVFTPRDAALADLEAAPLVQDQAWVSQALYLGFDAPLTGNAVSLFFLIDELDGGMADGVRLAVDALGKDGFRPLSAVDDQTNGLSESGTLTLNLPAPPVQTRLFGDDAWWLRLRPALAGQVEGWRPRLKGAWLNGCWALAAETIELERLGSSDGSPGQAVRLARPPVIADSLELRIREPLGDEDVEALTRDKADAVRQDLPGLPGVWVLWREVPDIDDAGPGERAYALDDERGEIRFGDGLHGRIPPIGRDAILAVAYRKGGGAAANGVRAWSKMNLVTPLQGVAEATIVEGAAGGADPQAPETALAFAPQALGLRDRALTLQDLAVLACQSSPGIAQAFAFRAGEGTCLVVVMAGRDPQPSQATLRELRGYLAERSLPSLIRKFELRGPARVELRIELTLDVDALAYSGQLAADAAGAVATLLHPAHGGLDGQGWPLGVLPGEAEIAAVLGELAHLRGIAAVTLTGSDGNAIVPPLAPHQLAVLAPDGVHCIFTATGGTAHA